MGKQTVRAKDVLRDLKAGVTDAELMNKYRLSEKGLQSLFRKLKEGGFVSDADIRDRAAPPESAPVSRGEEPQPPEDGLRGAGVRESGLQQVRAHEGG